MQRNVFALFMEERTMTASTIYWLNVYGNLHIAFKLLGMLWLIFVGIIILFDEYYLPKKAIIAIITISFIITSIIMFVPSKKTIMAMYIVPKITNIEGIKDLPEKTIKALDKMLDGYNGDAK